MVFVYSATSVMLEPRPPATDAVSVIVPLGGPSLAHDVSAASGPVMLEIAPVTGPPGTTVHVTVTGANLADATALIFILDGAPDAAINAANLTPNMMGDQLTADVVIGAAATPGKRVVIVQTPAGRSTAVYMEMTNVFAVP